MKRKKIFISAVNLNHGGTLTVAKEFFKAVDKFNQDNIIAFVHKKDLFPKYKNLRLIELPDIKSSWVKRMYFEYVSSKRIAKRSSSDIWICLHDMTANISNGKQYVYCHNPSPFYNDLKLKDFFKDYKFWLFVHLYKLLYRINLKKNTAIIVQQHWIAEKFVEYYHINNIIIARPESVIKNNSINKLSSKKKGVINIFYPSVPRIFKNFEVLLEAAEKMYSSGKKDVNFIVTFDGSENKYAHSLKERYKNCDNIKFMGYLNHECMRMQYENADIVCFPSKLETWGLPITEAKSYGLPLIVADLEYAHETVGEYDKVVFFDPDNAQKLTDIIVGFCEGNPIFNSKKYITSSNFYEVNGWDELTNYLIKD